MREYPKYKASGIDWFGEIPVGWDITKLKFLTSSITKGTTPSTVGKDFVDEGINYLKVESISNVGTILPEKCSYIDKETHKILFRSQLKERDIVISIAGAIGRVAIISKDILPANTNQAVGIIRLRKKFKNQKWITYLLNSEPILNHYKLEVVETAQANLSLENVGIVQLTNPSVSEQNAIVRFLDYKTGQIDSFIANRQKQIELLKEQLRKKIYSVLTKGLSNKDFKSTLLPWFPEIPKNWELYKFNAAIKLLHGFQFRDNHFREHGVKVAKITQLKADGSLDLSEASFVEEKFLIQLKDKIIKSGDILMALTGGTIGKIICVEDLQEELLQNYRVGKFIPRDKRQLNKEYMFWVLSSEFTFAQILFLQRETGQPNIGISDFSKMFFPMPNSLEEQLEIIKYIINQKSETDTLISKYQKQIELMQEYRTSLISQAVTGKIDVREWQPKKQQTA
jgi:type I restriction enzyme S subunit